MSRRLTLLVMGLLLPGMLTIITGATAQTPTGQDPLQAIRAQELQPANTTHQGGLLATATPFRFNGIVVQR